MRKDLLSIPAARGCVKLQVHIQAEGHFRLSLGIKYKHVFRLLSDTLQYLQWHWLVTILTGRLYCHQLKI